MAAMKIAVQFVYLLVSSSNVIEYRISSFTCACLVKYVENLQGLSHACCDWTRSLQTLCLSYPYCSICEHD